MFIVIDLETTGREPVGAHVVEYAHCITDEDMNFRSHTGFVRPPVPIPPETSAVHHIIDADVAAAPDWAIVSTGLEELIGANGPAALVAHNTDMERHFIGPLAPHVPWICTYRAALRIWPEAPAFSNEALRYWLKLPLLGRAWAQHTHSALHDAWVTTWMLRDILQHATVEQLIQWTEEPPLLPRCPIGQYRNLPWAEVPTDWLEWALYKATGMRADVTHACRLELDRRHAPGDSVDAELGPGATVCDGEMPF